MFIITVLFAIVAVSSAHSVLPFAHGPVLASLVAPIAPYPHGYVGGHGLLGYGGHNVLEHGYGSGHHILKRSPHVVPVGYLGAEGHFGGVTHLGVGHLGGAGHLGAIGHLGGDGHLGGIGHLGGVGHLGGAGHLGGVGPLSGLGHVVPVAHVAPAAAIAPVAVSHQSRVDVRHSPAVVAAPIVPIVKPVIAPAIHAGSLAYDAGHYGSTYSHLGHY